MHKKVQQIMNEKFTVADYNGKQRNWMTQFDMSITQFAFVGLAMIYPAKCGLIAATEKELLAINYYWRVLGYLMGIEDEYNLCQFDNYKQVVELNKLALQEFVSTFEREPNEKGLSMTQALTKAMKYYLPSLTFNNLAYWWADCFSFNGYQLQPQTKREKLLFAFMKLSMNSLISSTKFGLPASTWLHRKVFDIRLKKREIVYAKLKDKYANSSQYCYYSDRIDYFEKKELKENGIRDEFVPLSCPLSSTKTTKTSAKITLGCPFKADDKQQRQVQADKVDHKVDILQQASANQIIQVAAS